MVSSRDAEAGKEVMGNAPPQARINHASSSLLGVAGGGTLWAKQLLGGCWGCWIHVPAVLMCAAYLF